MSPEEIRALDGPALCRLARELGLAPPGAVQHADGRIWGEEGPQRQWRLWAPDEHLHQGDACVRLLRVLGWKTRAEGTARRGCVWADHRDTGDGVMVTWPSPYATTEALALLRCACLALANSVAEPAP